MQLNFAKFVNRTPELAGVCWTIKWKDSYTLGYQGVKNSVRVQILKTLCLQYSEKHHEAK